MNRILINAILVLMLLYCVSYSQTIYMPASSEIYSFLKRMEARQLLNDYKDAAKPLSRMVLAKMLKSLEPKVNEMTRVERETYEFLVMEFKYELLKISGDPEPSEMRWHLFSSELTKGILNFDINYQFTRKYFKDGETHGRAQGIKLYGYAFDDVGFYFRWIDHRETGEGVNYQRNHTPEAGYAHNILNTVEKRLEYNESDVQFTWQTGSFTFSLEKNTNLWGYGSNGNVIFSNKAPSYAQIKMRVPISKDIDFVYFHGELNSNMVDSSRSYTVIYPSSSYQRDVDRLKYIAAHQIEISLFKGVDLSIGESVVYSDRGPLLIYLIPVMYFKAGEWYNRDKDNVQMFGSLDLNLIKDVNAYLSLFIDELNTDDLFDSDKSHRQVAFTGGIQAFDFPMTNLDLTIEYTRANPWVYNHKYPAVTFTNNGYDLGHWIGQNADDIFLKLGFTPIQQLRVEAFVEAYRKGGKADITNQYAPEQGKLPFLYDLQHEERSFGIRGRYQPLRDIFVDLSAKTIKVEDKTTLELNKNNIFEIYLSASIGL